jgi:hypothetical protein
MKRSWAAPLEHVNRRRETIAAMSLDEIGRERGIPFKIPSQIGTALDLVEEMKQRFWPEGV